MSENSAYGKITKDDGVEMKVHPNVRFNNMIKSGLYKVINRKFPMYFIAIRSPCTPITAMDLQNSCRTPQIKPFQNQYYIYDLDPNLLAEAEPTSIVSKLWPAAESADTVSELLSEAGPISIISGLPVEAKPVSIVSELLYEAEPVSIVSELPAEAEQVSTLSERPAEAEPVSIVSELPAEAEPVSVASDLSVGSESTSIASKPRPAAEPADTASKLLSEVESVNMLTECKYTGSDSQISLESEASSADLDIQSSSAAYQFETNTLEFVNFELPQEPTAEESTLNPPPYINFILFNRLGLTVKNLTNLLDSDENFELNIIDCNSKDNSWDYIQSLTDSRIKSKTRFKKNLGPIYAANYGLSRRKPNQYFITIDSDTFIKTKNWICRFMEVFEAFPEVGLLGVMRDNPYPRYLPPIVPKVNGAAYYLELKNADIGAQMDFIPGQLQCLSPRLIQEIGYWSEENGFGDAEISPRIVHYTNFTVGFVTTIEIDMTQKITCDECLAKNFCTLSRSINDCFSFSKKLNKNESFVEKNTWKFKQTCQELQEQNRTAYCASIHDPESIRNHIYHSELANENFNHYLLHSN